jgi:hypothetical protein
VYVAIVQLTPLRGRIHPILHRFSRSNYFNTLTNKITTPATPENNLAFQQTKPFKMLFENLLRNIPIVMDSTENLKPLLFTQFIPRVL